MYSFGQIHEGGQYNLQIGLLPGDTYPNDFKCKVRIKDNATGNSVTVGGHGEFVGNFSPIWVKMKIVDGITKFGSGRNFRRKERNQDEAKGWKFLQLTEIESIPYDAPTFS